MDDIRERQKESISYGENEVSNVETTIPGDTDEAFTLSVCNKSIITPCSVDLDEIII